MINDKVETVIELKNVHANYDNKLVLKEVNLTIKEREHWVILGSNGSGKSTLIKLLLNDLFPNPKFPYIKKIFSQERWETLLLKKKLGIITNDLHTYFQMHGNYLTAYEVVLSGYYASIGIFKHQDFTQEQHARALEVLEFLEISHLKEKKVEEMSTGQLRRCIIGRALIHNPQAFILDEPTVGLDIKSQYNFIQIIRKLSKQATIILVTHHIEEIFPEVTNVALMYKNCIFKQGKKEEILTSENLSEIFEINIDIASNNERYYIQSVNP